MSLLEPDWVMSPAGLYVPEAVAERAFRVDRRPVAIDLFSGCGGFSCGLFQAGYRVIAAAENDCASAITYMMNLATYPVEIHFVEPSDRERLDRYLEQGLKRSKGPIKTLSQAGSAYISHHPEMQPGCSHFFFGDLTKLTGEDILEPLDLGVDDVDLVVGGPPCQGFSTSGKKDPKDPRNKLVFEFIRLCLEIRPKSLCMENVSNIVNMTTADGEPVMDVILNMLERGDYAGRAAMEKMLDLQFGKGAVIHRASKRTMPKATNRTRTEEPASAQADLFAGAEERAAP